MSLKLLKAVINLEIKADRSDPEHVREQVYDQLMMLIESDELSFDLDEEEEEVEDES